MKGANRSSNHVVQIPEDIILEILKELLAKSLLRFKCVSKGWCNMIEDPEFVAFDPAAPTSSFTRIYLKSIGEFFLVDSKGISVPVAIPDIIVKEYYSGNFLRMHDVVRPVEGLVCFNDFAWNPTVRKIINLPLRKVKERRDIITGFVSYEREFGNENFLGFDASTRKCKLIPAPDDDKICRMVEVRECPGLMNLHRTKIWILEDFENRKWNVVNILWPS
ncbi:hypothetical protein ACH5RR_036058 [Cinchona calisaya]|uniref:F-box domain-containing protein n=1 Tax=Cinchona calisaya TaxID=153742 RepID=A0ABD2Y5P1_9GENT